MLSQLTCFCCCCLWRADFLVVFIDFVAVVVGIFFKVVTVVSFVVEVYLYKVVKASTTTTITT